MEVKDTTLYPFPRPPHPRIFFLKKRRKREPPSSKVSQVEVKV